MTRIIAGEWRGHSLPKLNTGSVRPTTDRARTVLFDTLWDVKGLSVLDLYSGTGALGFESLSRGAAELISIDQDRSYIDKQKQWIHRFESPFKGLVGDVEQVLRRLEQTFDLIFADPPYAEGISDAVLRLIETRIAPGGRFVYERDKGSDEPLDSEIFSLMKEKIVAQTRIEIYKAERI
ncbi:MAG: RsmD family RNA methyltransferase [Candidatus Marinimicrobia bacterium]|nr:RsmD family RNA methyltransferase [Candidatus Neomarinimicrobiota bacterium]MCF7851017.1 RsmD family RNA methyltransferase [Candidatus Neomarinimicrobiota bacterium]